MSIANVLSTNTVNFQDLVGNGKTYRVPPFQRDYSWTQEEWEDLWQDINETRPDPKSRHYMGAVVVKPESDRDFLVIDGQQRIATLTILSLAVIKRLEELGADLKDNQERAVALRNRFVGEKDPASLAEISKLSLNELDDGFFQDYLVQLRAPANPRSLPQSNRLLWECFSYFEQQIRKSPELREDGKQLAELLSEVVARRLLFILITVEDEISAYTVFETLNARGLELTTTDLLKNYLFSRVGAQSDLQFLQRRWKRLTETVRQDRFGEFLRYHYLTLYPQVRSARLFKMVRDTVKTPAEVLDLLTVLEGRAEVFDALLDPNHSMWTDLPSARGPLTELNLFKVRQMIPLLFAAREKLSSELFAKTLKLVSVISFRYTIISGLNTNDLEPAYHRAARDVLAGTADKVSKIRVSLADIYVPDDKFISDFEQVSVATSGPRKRIAKYILSQLEVDASGRAIDFQTDPGTIEHILPENPLEGWESSFDFRDWPQSVNRLGNLTLLSPTDNRSVDNNPYPDKVSIYQASTYRLTQDVATLAPTEWSLPLLVKRQKTLAKRAAHIWRFDGE